MFVHAIAVGMMQVAIVQMVNMIAMTDGGMATPGAMLMQMSKMFAFVAVGHRRCLLSDLSFCPPRRATNETYTVSDRNGDCWWGERGIRLPDPPITRDGTSERDGF
jgi:hypothetical protein